MVKNVLFTLILTALLGSSCSNKNELPEPPVEEEDTEIPGSNVKNPYKTGVDLSASKTIRWEKAWAGEQFYMLGYGYDATGKYAHPAFIKGKVINIKKYHEDNESLVLFLRANSAEHGLSIRGTYADCLKTISERAGFTVQEIGQYKNLFSGTFNGAFENDNFFEDLSYNFLGTSEILASSLIAFDYPQHRKEWFLTNYLTDEFKEDIDTKSAEEIIELYGTHLLMHIKVGQRIDYLYRYAEDKNSNSDSWFFYNIPQYFTGLGLLGGSRPKTDSPLKENMYVEVVDGAEPSPNVWMLDITNYEKERVQFNDWDELTEEHLTLVDFWMRDKPLTPIYDFVADEKKKKALMTAYQKYLGEKQFD